MTNPNGYLPPGTGAGMEGSASAAMLIPAIGGIVDTVVSSETAKRNTDKTIAAQKAEAELAYQRQVAMWHMQNAYNSPAEQMKRFGAAGLNPHLIYGHGTPGNSSGTPQYQPANLQYRYAAPAYGAAVSSILPTLMSVGTWMQNMRQSEVDIQSKQTNIEKAEQLIDFLRERNPREIQKLDNVLSVYPYQRSLLYSQQELAQRKVQEIDQEMFHRFGLDGKGGVRALQYAKELAEMKLKTAQASWTDLNVTNPQGLIQLVLSGVMGMAGQQLRLSTHRGGSMSRSAKRVKTYYENGRRRSQVVDY